MENRPFRQGIANAKFYRKVWTYLFAPMGYKGTILPVKFTIKEYKQQGIGKRIYSLEAIDVEIKQAKGAGH